MLVVGGLDLQITLEDEQVDEHQHERVRERPGEAEHRALVLRAQVAPEEARRRARGSGRDRRRSSPRRSLGASCLAHPALTAAARTLPARERDRRARGPPRRGSRPLGAAPLAARRPARRRADAASAGTTQRDADLRRRRHLRRLRRRASLLALAIGAVEPSRELLGVLGGCALLFVAGLVDDLLHLSPLAKLAAQFGAAAIVLASGLSVEIVGNDVLAIAIALVWLVGITNAFNLLDNMDGLAATLAAIACALLRARRGDGAPERRRARARALARLRAASASCPFNLRPGRSAAVFMGDSGSQVLGFALASLALSSSWKVAGTTLATMVLPLLVLAIPILDTTLVTSCALLERRPGDAGRQDHTLAPARLLRALASGKAVALLAAVATALGATGARLQHARHAAADRRRRPPHLRPARPVRELARRPRGALAPRRRAGDRAARGRCVPAAAARRGARRLRARSAPSFLAAYVCSRSTGSAGRTRRRSSSPRCRSCRRRATSSSSPFGVYRRVWRFAGAHDAAAIAAAVFALRAGRAGAPARSPGTLGDFPHEIFFVDPFLCLVLVGASRFALRRCCRGWANAARRDSASSWSAPAAPGGASRASCNETPGKQVVGFLDDNPRLRRRRVIGVTVLGGLDDAQHTIAAVRADEVLVTIPDSPAERLQQVADACAAAGVACTFVRREAVTPPLARVDRRVRAAAPRRSRAHLGCDPARGRLSAPLHPVRVAGGAPRHADDLHGRARVRADLALDRRNRATRRGSGSQFGFESLYTYLPAPAWWIDDTADAYGAAKTDRRARDDAP